MRVQDLKDATLDSLSVLCKDVASTSALSSHFHPAKTSQRSLAKSHSGVQLRGHLATHVAFGYSKLTFRPKL